MDWKNVLERAAWTFVQAFVGAFTVVPFVDLEGAKVAAAPALAAGVAALLSFVKTVAQEKLRGTE